MTINDTELRQKLQELQGDMTDSQFARKLGVSVQLWNMTHLGRRQINYKVLKAVSKTFPELKQEVWNYLADYASYAPESHQNRLSAELRKNTREVIRKVHKWLTH